ncbi:MAG: hypothetical protein HY903_12105 [Deltaproteobacteria bacterium]|nr:hypothetical protein [Deltaproteobacteria bacterium]
MLPGAVLAGGCGGAGDGDLQTAYQDESRCLSCGALPTDPQQDPSDPAPKVTAAPLEVMFYPTTLDSPEFGPKQVTISNLTAGTVAVTRVLLLDDPKQSAGGNQFFALDDWSGKVILATGEQTTVGVRFLGSAEQQSAVLVVSTTDPVYYTLDVFLTGKYFVDVPGI